VPSLAATRRVLVLVSCNMKQFVGHPVPSPTHFGGRRPPASTWNKGLGPSVLMLIGLTARWGWWCGGGVRRVRLVSGVSGLGARGALYCDTHRRAHGRRLHGCGKRNLKAFCFLSGQVGSRDYKTLLGSRGRATSPLRQWRAAREGIGEETGDAAVPGDLAFHLSRNSSAEARRANGKAFWRALAKDLIWRAALEAASGDCGGPGWGVR
jgi:hypothetical protein